MNTKRYGMGLRFAAIFNSEFRYDILHDAWLYYFEKTGNDLFTINLKNESGYMYTVIKKAFYRWLYAEGKNYTYKDVRRSFVPLLAETGDENFIVAGNQEACFELNRVTTIGDTLVGTQGMVYRYLFRGYRPFEISEIEGMSQPLIQYYWKTIKQRLN